MKRYYIYIIFSIIHPIFLFSQETQDSALFRGELDEAIITEVLDIKSSITHSNIKTILLKTAPSFLGQPDALKIVQFLPGIQSNREGDVGISVRSGDYDETLISLDRAPIYNTSHLKGFFSTFNTSQISDIYIYKGAFPSKYGSRTSGIIDIRSKDGDFHKHHGEISLGILSSSISFEGPLSERTSFIIGGRASYLNLIALPIYKRIAKHQETSSLIFNISNMDYYDIDAKVTHKIDNNNTISGKFYLGKDRIGSTINEKTEEVTQNGTNKENWGNLAGIVSLQSNPSNKLTIDSYIYYSNYHHTDYAYSHIDYKSTKLNKGEETTAKADNKSSIQDYSLGCDLTLDLNSHQISLGAKYSANSITSSNEAYNEIINYIINPHTINNTNINQTDFSSTDYLHSISLYIEDEITIGKWINLGLGSRLSLYTTKDKTEFAPEPRVRFSLHPIRNFNIALKGSYSRLSQGLHQLSKGNITQASDIWISMSEDIPVMTSDNYTLGIYISPLLCGKKIDFIVEAYHRKTKNIIEYSESASLSGIENIYDIVEKGISKVSGLDFQIEKEGTTYWNIAYTLSKAENQFDDINNGEWYLSKFDCRHQFSAILSQSIGKNLTISASFKYKTGQYLTLENLSYPSVGSSLYWYKPSLEEKEPYGGYRFYYDIMVSSDRYNFKMPDYHKLDISIDYKIYHKTGTSTINLTVNNVYNRHNPYMLNYYNQNHSIRSICIFPIMPSLTYKYEF